MTLKELIKEGETNTLEFKETFRFNIETNQKDKNLKDAVSKAVCGMLNSEGGIVLIGVDDNKNIKGVERDLDLYGEGTEANKIDRLVIDLNKHLTDSLSIKSKRFLNIKIITIDKIKIIKIEISSSNEPFFHSKEETFYVRDGPRTIILSNKKMGEYISERTKIHPIQSEKELLNENLDEIAADFHNWVEIKLENNLKLKINREPWDGKICDYVFGCIFPHSLSDDFIDLGFLKSYIDDYSIIKRSQTYKTPEFACQFEPDIGEAIKIFPDGKIYFCLIYNYVNPEEPTFSLGYLMAEYHELLNVEGLQTKYNAPFSSIKWSRLESLLEVICFIFHSECNVKIAKTPTESFLLEIILPDMIINGNRRVLFRHDGLPTYKKYLGENKDIIIRKPFEYNEISEFVNSIKTIIIDFFKNPITRGYGY